MMGPFLNFRLKLIKQEVDVLCRFPDRSSTVEFAARIDEVEGVKEMAAFVALITSGIIVVAARALSLDISISQKGAVFLTERLLGSLLSEETIVPETFEDGLGDLGVLWCRRAAKDIEAYFKPLIHLAVNLVVLCAELLRSDLLL